jgi:uncharacterized membrane protein
MESDRRYYARRALEEFRAAERAVTPEAQARRRALAQLFADKAQGYVGDLPAAARAEWPVHA